MRRSLLALCLAAACAEPVPADDETVPAMPVPDAARRVVDAVEASLAPLEACGRAPGDLFLPVAPRIFTSTDAVFAADEVEALKHDAAMTGLSLDPDPRFAADGGHFQLPLDGATCEVTLLDRQGQPFRHDPFHLDSYLDGVVVLGPSYEDARARDEQPWPYLFAFEALGPEGAALGSPTSPIQVVASIWDLLGLGTGLAGALDAAPDLGAFDALRDLEVTGSVVADGAEGITFEGRMHTTVGGVWDLDPPALELVALRAEAEGWTVEPVDGGLQLATWLRGDLLLRADGPGGERYDVTIAFGAWDADAPEQAWTCVAGCGRPGPVPTPRRPPPPARGPTPPGSIGPCPRDATSGPPRCSPPTVCCSCWPPPSSTT